MNDEVGKGSSGSGASDIPTGSRVDPTGVMPPVDQGPPVESYSVSEAQAEWKKMTSKDEDYKDLPRSVFLKRRDAMFKRGFSERLAEEEETRQEESRKWLEEENERIEERDHLEEMEKVRRNLELHFGGEKEAKAAIQTARSVVKRFATKNDIAFLESSRLGNDPEMIQTLAKIGQILERKWKEGKKK